MKNLLFLTLLLAVLLPNCKKEQIIIKTPVPPDTIAIVDTTKQHIIELNKSAVLKNGVLWNTPLLCYYRFGSKEKFQLHMSKNPGGEFSENFHMEDIPGQLGKHVIKFVHAVPDFNDGTPDAAFNFSNYDAGLGSFYPDTTRNDNFIEVLRYDTITNEVEGRFQVFMGLRGGPSTEPGVPDSVFLTEGKFYLKLQ